MCLGIPMQVVAREGIHALCQGMGEERRVDIRLVGEVSPGSWLLVFLDSAREVLSADQAARIGEALLALDLAMRGESDLDHLFPDLARREPRLPDFLDSRPSDCSGPGESPCLRT
jgi:hydrogenase expression/formation protein HypC